MKVSAPLWERSLLLLACLWLLSAAPARADSGVSPDSDSPPSDGGSSSPRALVSVAFDDGWLSSYVHAVPIMQELGIRASHYIVAGWVDKPGYQSDYMTSEQLQELVWAGHELGSHSSYHHDLTQLADTELQEDIFASKRTLEELGFAIVGFVPPGGAVDPRGTALVKQQFGYLRTIEAGLNLPPYDRYWLRCVIVLNTTTLAEVAGWVEQAASQGGWLILLYHRLSRDASLDTFVTPERFRASMEHLVQTKALVLPVGEVLQLWKPAAPPAPVETGKSLPSPDLQRQETGCRLRGAATCPEPTWLLVLLLSTSALLVRRYRG